MAFVFGTTSRTNMAGVHSDMIRVSEAALSLSEQDFGFPSPNCRTAAEEAVLIAQGKSHTMHSHHIPGPQGAGPVGFSGAVDAVPWNGSAFVWEWPRIFVIARAFKTAAEQLSIDITWGGVWDKLMSEYNDPEAEQAAYIKRRKASGQASVFVDGPHFELGRN